MVLACLHSTGVQTVGLTHYLPTVLQSSKCDAGKNRIEGKLTSHGFILKKGGKAGEREREGREGWEERIGEEGNPHTSVHCGSSYSKNPFLPVIEGSSSSPLVLQLHPSQVRTVEVCPGLLLWRHTATVYNYSHTCCTTLYELYMQVSPALWG